MSNAIAAAGMTRPSSVSGASMRMSPSQKMSNLFDTMDANGTGAVTQSQLSQALQTQNPPAGFKSVGADAIFAKLDVNGTGSVSKADFVDGMTSLMSAMRQQRSAASSSSSSTDAASSQASLDASLQALNSLGDQAPSPNTSKGALVNALL